MGWLDRIVNVHFGDDELVFFHYEYNVAFLHQEVPPAVLDCQVVINDTGVERSILGNMLDGKKTVAVAQPNVSADMLSNLYSWTPKPSVTKTSVLTTPSQTIFFVDNGTVQVTADNYNDIYPHGTNLCGVKVSNLDAAGHVFWECNSTLQIELQRKLGDKFNSDIFNGGPGYVNESDAQYVADGFNLSSNVQDGDIPAFFVSSLLVEKPQSSSSRAGAAIFILNAGLLKAKLPAGRAATTIRFQVGSQASDLINWTLNAGVYTSTKSFPVDNNLNPTFANFPQASAGDFTGGVTITATVTLGKKPTVSLDHGQGTPPPTE